MRTLDPMSIVARIVDAARKFSEDNKLREVNSFEKSVKEIEKELLRLKKANTQYFNLIERVLAQRDEWKNLYLLHVREHQNAQELYEKEIVKLRKMLQNCLKIANHERKVNGGPEITKPSDLDGLLDLPVGMMEEYAKRIAHARSLLGNEIDGAAERDEIASRG